MTISGAATGGGGGGGEEPAATTRIQLKLPTAVVAPLVAITSCQTCWPAASVTPVARTVVHVCHPPVFGTVIDPVLLTPPIATWKVPPAPPEATRNSMSYVPAVVTFTVYLSHSPAKAHPTL